MEETEAQRFFNLPKATQLELKFELSGLTRPPVSHVQRQPPPYFFILVQGPGAKRALSRPPLESRRQPPSQMRHIFPPAFFGHGGNDLFGIPKQNQQNAKTHTYTSAYNCGLGEGIRNPPKTLLYPKAKGLSLRGIACHPPSRNHLCVIRGSARGRPASWIQKPWAQRRPGNTPDPTLKPAAPGA